MMISNRPGAVRPGSSGTIIPGLEARIVDDNNRTVAQGETGNLLVRADSVCACYWNQHEKTKDTIEGHWIRTGDKYYQDEDGYFWYAGRSDDMLKVSGMWISPIEIEGVLIEHPAVQEAAVVARADQDGLTKPVACIVLRDGVSGTPELARELQDFVVSRLPVFKRPHAVEFFLNFPRQPRESSSALNCARQSTDSVWAEAARLAAFLNRYGTRIAVAWARKSNRRQSGFSRK